MSAASETEPESARAGVRLGLGLLVLFTLALASYQLWTGWQERALVQAAPRFEQAQGEVVDVSVKSRGGTGQSSVRLLVRYTVASRDWELRTTGHDMRLRFEGDAQALLGAYAIGQQLVVHYDPESPGRATLSPAAPASRAWASGWACLALGFGVGAWAWRRERRRAS